MGARAVRRARQQEAGANGHRHANQPSREQLHRENVLLLRENQELRRKVDLERQLAGRKRNSTNSSKPPSSDGLADEQRPRGRKHRSKRKPGAQPDTRDIIDDWFRNRGERH